MPRLKRRRKNRTGYSDRHRLQLRVRWDFFGGGFGDGPEAVPAMKAAWLEIGDSVLEEHIHERPGTRPWAWWQFDAPEQRDDNETETDYLRRLQFLTATELTALENAVTS